MLICKGRSYSEPINVHWDEFMEKIKSPLEKVCQFWVKFKNIDETVFAEIK